ncbi:hypothetical protein ACHWQZ_G014621 [Mnemiopsis leidyi]
MISQEDDHACDLGDSPHIMRHSNILNKAGLSGTIATGTPPLDLWLSEEAAKGALRLRDLGHWLPPPAGRPSTRLTSHISTNDRLLRDIPECNIIREERTPALSIDQTFQVEIPTKETYQEADYEQYEITCFTDGSKTTEGVGSGLTIRASPGNENLNLEESNHHNDQCTVFQAEVYAVGKAATILNDKKVVGKNILINCDSQSAIRAINSTVIKTRTIEQTTRELNDLGRANNVLLRWIPAHKGTRQPTGLQKMVPTTAMNLSWLNFRYRVESATRHSEGRPSLTGAEPSQSVHPKYSILCGGTDSAGDYSRWASEISEWPLKS